MKWRLLALLCLASFKGLAQTTTVSQYQYWFDNDIANRDSIATTSAAQVTLSASVSTASLSTGLHSLNSRFKQSDGKYSITVSQFFIKTPAGTGTSRLISGYEYWFDNDYANKVSQSVTAINTLSLTTAINPGVLPSGLHTFHIRFRDNSSDWSSVVSQLFLKTPASGGSGTKTIAGYEYWFDADFTGRTSQSIAPATQVQIVNAISTSALGNGVHSFNVRFRDSGNVWSVVKSSLFLKTAGSGNASSRLITGYEYWFDNAYSNRVSQSVTQASQLQLSAALNTSALGNGVRTIHVRFKDNGNIWSTVLSTLVLKQPSSSNIDSTVVTAMRYWIDTAKSQMQKVYVPQPMRSVTILKSIDVSYLDTGKHYIYFQFQDTLHSWSSVLRDSFRFVGVVLPDIVVGTMIDSACAGTSLQVPFTLHTTFNSTNIFTAQLSNSAGSFASPTNIGTRSGNTAGTISATIPAASLTGAAYRVRIIASSPADTSGPDSTAIIIRRVPEQTFGVSGPLLSCTTNASYGITSAQTGASYSWQAVTGGSVSPANTSASVSWTSAGTHLLIATALNACGNGLKDTITVSVLSSTPASSPVITVSGNDLNSSALISGASGYQWYRNDTLIVGATASLFTPLVTATYKVCFSNVCGLGTKSAGTYYFVRAPQTISFASINGKTYGDAPFRLNATASSSLPVSYIVSGPSTLTGDTLTITGTGVITVTAIQGGDTAFKPATSVVRTFTVAKAAQTVSITSVGNKTYGNPAVTLNAAASTALPVSYSIQSGPATLNGNVLSITGGGRVIVRASQAGNQNYLPAFVEDTFCVSAPQPDTIRGYTTSCISTQRYYVDSVQGVTYAWLVSGGGFLSMTSGGAVNVSWASLGNYVLTIAANTSCNAVTKTKTLAVQVATPLSPAAPVNLYPADSLVIGAFPSPFSWQPSANTQVYDIYIWPAGASMPATPTFANVAQIGKTISSGNLAGFSPGAWYKWKVIAKNACSQASSVVRSFQVANLPDLIVSSLVAPDTAFSNTSIAVAITVKNTGHAATNGSWIDYLSISSDSLTNFVAPTALNSSFNIAALDTQQSYTRTLNVTLPQNIVGSNFLHATAGPASAEISTTNNHTYRGIYIKQSPLPDLRVQSVLTTGNTFSGKDIAVTWTVKNHGTGNTAVGAWTDNIYISQDSTFSTSTAILMGTSAYNAGTLYHDSSYSKTKTVSLPVQMFGKCYVYVFADANNQVYESAFENNNTGRSDSLIIYLTPPPDYQVVNFNVPQNVSRGESINVDWTIKNAGAIRRTKDSIWTDGIRISSDSASKNLIASYSFSPPKVHNPACGPFPLSSSSACPDIVPLMDAEDVYYQTGNITMPGNFDSVFIQLKTDNTNAIFEYLNEGNNTSAVIKRTFLKPDLSVQSIYLPVPLSLSYVSNTYSIRWTVKNSGPGKMAGLWRKDVIFLSRSQTLNVANALRIDSLSYNSAIDTGSIVTNDKQIRIPDTVSSGSYYVFVVTDADNAIQETNKANNAGSIFFQLHMPKPADLHVTGVTIAPTGITAEHSVRLTYTVVNQDSGAVLGSSWKDKAYLSKSASWNKDSALLVATYSHASSLRITDTYTEDDSILIKSSYLQQLGLDSASGYFYVWTDADTEVYEGSNEQNNISRSSAVYMQLLRHPDLEEIALTVPDSLWSGKTGNLSWTIRNNAGATKYFTSYWEDGLYLSADTLLSASDVPLRTVAESHQLDSNQQYNDQATFNVPNGISGNYYLLMVTDDGNRTSDNNRSNNYKILHNPNGSPHAVYISLTPPPDLIVESLTMPAISYSGQPSMVKWRLKNQGAGPTPGAAWNERFYLSTDTVLDAGDVALTTYHHNGILGIGSTYSDSMMVYMPITAEGNYYLLEKTDFNDLIYEHTNENNNVRQVLCFIIKPDPADLIVRNVVVDSGCFAGDTAQVSWVVQNIGVNPARGYMSQGIYLSKDTSWSNEDVIMAYPDYSIALTPNDTAHFSAKFRVTDVSAGNYNAIIRTDLKNNIVEDNDANNDGPSSAPIYVSIPQLPLDTIKYNVLKRNYELYYRIDIPAAQAGQTVSVTLKGDSVNGLNELYLRYDSIATRAKYDYKYDQPGGNQVIVIPAVKAGTYYVLAYGATTTASQQSISLLAKRINFSILSFQSHDGGNKGTVTIKISGAKFQAGMAAWLYSASLGTITASSVYYVNTTLAYATFNLAGKQTGAYNLKLIKPGVDSVTAADVFTIVTGKGSTTAGGGNSSNANGFQCSIKNIGVEDLLGFEVQRPGSTPPQRVFSMTVIFANSGDQDIPMPTRMLISENGYPVSLTTPKLTENKQELFLEFREVDGPPNILRPGAVGYITVFTKSAGGGTTMNFSLVE